MKTTLKKTGAVKIIIRKSAAVVFCAAAMLLMLFFPAVKSQAEATDEIKNFTITVDVNEDASLKMLYHIDWKVLDDSIGMLEWIDLGIPNRYHEDITALSDTIDHINDNGNSLAIYLDRSYGEGETVSLDFSMTQDHMYQINKYKEGETVYTFTPAWFDSMDVDQLTIRWNAENTLSWQPDCLQEDGYLLFDTSVSPGGKYTVSVTYPNDAFAFAEERQASSDAEYTSGTDEDLTPTEWFLGILGLVFSLAIVVAPFVMFFKFLRWILGGTGFGSEQKTEKKITRTKIEYYETCPGCGAPREEGKDACSYCGRSMIKSKEVVEEDQLENPEKYTEKGTYRYGSSDNTYIRVNVINVPVGPPPRFYSRSSRSSSHSSRSGGSSGHRSSCACACVSSCACACACASSGRAGCSVKDFYNGKLKRQGPVRLKVSSKENN